MEKNKCKNGCSYWIGSLKCLNCGTKRIEPKNPINKEEQGNRAWFDINAQKEQKPNIIESIGAIGNKVVGHTSKEEARHTEPIFKEVDTWERKPSWEEDLEHLWETEHITESKIKSFISDLLDKEREKWERDSHTQHAPQNICPPHNFIAYNYVGSWGGSTPPPNMKCTKCSMETRL